MAEWQDGPTPMLPNGTQYIGLCLLQGKYGEFYPMPVVVPQMRYQRHVRDWTSQLPTPPAPAPLLTDLEKQGHNLDHVEKIHQRRPHEKITVRKKKTDPKESKINTAKEKWQPKNDKNYLI